jgi:UDP-N-acetylglucosamine--N-acetylmuramyl-(pentapeptide) pyrophosphoryl-undecaprenol N-acetylglucosamine transferase
MKQEVLDVVFNDWLVNKFRENLHRMSRENTIDILVQDLEQLARREPPHRHLRHTPASAPTA